MSLRDRIVSHMKKNQALHLTYNLSTVNLNKLSNNKHDHLLGVSYVFDVRTPIDKRSPDHGLELRNAVCEQITNFLCSKIKAEAAQPCTALKCWCRTSVNRISCPHNSLNRTQSTPSSAICCVADRIRCQIRTRSSSMASKQCSSHRLYV